MCWATSYVREGPICLGPKPVTFKKKKKEYKKEGDWEKKKIERREKRGKTHLWSRFICGPIELKFGRGV